LCWVFLGHIRILSPERKRQENRDGSQSGHAAPFLHLGADLIAALILRHHQISGRGVMVGFSSLMAPPTNVAS
ncbi:hypothetical protein QN357_18535, partial [Cryobacterium sp. RTC2.1]|uniref:hypothetical protein n=1 Tax=Cryobacterium sp. RTC2.1 TaxID=3048634 RepID=UPI002B238176